MVQWVFIEVKDRFNLPVKSGIYCIIAKSSSSLKYLYIGKSINLKSRVNSHLEFINICISNCVDGEDIILGYKESTEYTLLEKNAISFYQPPHNCAVGKKARTDLSKKITTVLDGRTLRWLSMEIKIPESDLCKMMTGKKQFTEEIIYSINKRLSSNVKLTTK